MGEITDAVLDGTFCEACGELIDDGGAPGHPRYCSPECAGDRGATFSASSRSRSSRQPKSFECQRCRKRFRKMIGLEAHLRDVHGVGRSP